MPPTRDKNIRFNPDIMIINRKMMGMNQRDLAKRVGVSHVTIHAWENGKCIPVAKWFPKIATALKVNVKHLFTMVPNESPA